MTKTLKSQESSAANLISIRCPNQFYSKKYNKNLSCFELCVRVKPGSTGEAYCRRCRKKFNFEVQTQSGEEKRVSVKPTTS